MKFLKQSTYIRLCNSKAIEISPNQHADLLRFLFTEDSLNNKKGPRTSFQTTFSKKFYDKKSYLVMLHKLTKFHYQAVFASQVIQ